MEYVRLQWRSVLPFVLANGRWVHLLMAFEFFLFTILLLERNRSKGLGNDSLRKVNEGEVIGLF